MSVISLPEDAPDLSLRGVAFARISEGRMVARGTASKLDYRRSGGRMNAEQGAAQLVPEKPGTGLASLGALRLHAPFIDGEIASRRGNAWGGVGLDAERGDEARTEAVHYEGDIVSSQTPVAARGPGYVVDGHGLNARTDGSRLDLTGGVQGQLQMEAQP